MSVFRERALERISSAEELDQIVTVTSPRRWLALVALLVAVGAAVVWAVVSTVPTTVSGTGYLLPLEGLAEIQAPVAGTVRGLTLQPGTHVVAGQAVATIEEPGGRSVPVRAPKTGVVTEIDALESAVTPAGKRVALVEPVGWPLVVYAYVPTDVAAGLSVGTPARVTLAGGLGEKYGYITGQVESVSRFAVTPDRLAFVLQGTSVVSQVEQLGAVNEVVVDLDQTAETPSGLVWSQGSGPAVAPSAGLPGSIKFVTGSHHPIDDVL
jgi:biotin carboxyl carrier protein